MIGKIKNLDQYFGRLRTRDSVFSIDDKAGDPVNTQPAGKFVLRKDSVCIQIALEELECPFAIEARCFSNVCQDFRLSDIQTFKKIGIEYRTYNRRL